MICDVLIITGKDNNLGSGHFQRMAALLWRLRTKYRVNAYMLVSPNNGTYPLELKELLVEKTQPAGLIVRDMRDSHEYEIRELKKLGKVCVIDDRGKGRMIADVRIDLLPHFEKTDDAANGSFLYGYNFIQNLEALAGNSIEKKIDVAIYSGFSGESCDYLLTLLPDNCSYCLLGGAKPLIREKGESVQIFDDNYARLLCASKVAMSHFGIFLYEAFAAQCRIVTVNPTKYHSEISESAKEALNLINVGVRGAFDSAKAKDVVLKTLRETLCTVVDSGKVLEGVLLSTDRFAEYLLGLL